MDWRERHAAAWETPKPGVERAMVLLIKGWVRYGNEHRRTYDAPLGEDCYLGPLWADMGKALLGLLNGDFGPRLEGGALDAMIRTELREHGFPDD